MKNSQRQYLICFMIGLLVLDAVAANINVNTGRSLRKGKGVVLNSRDIYRQPNKHIGLVNNNKKVLVKSKSRGAYGAGSAAAAATVDSDRSRHLVFSQPSKCPGSGETTLDETFDTLTIKQAQVGEICTTQKSVNYLTCETRTVDKLVPRHISVGTLKQVHASTGEIKSFEVPFRTQKNVQETIQVLHNTHRTIQVVKKVQFTVETLVPEHVTIQTLAPTQACYQTLTQYNVTLDKVVPKAEKEAKIKLIPANMPAQRSKQVPFRVIQKKEVPFKVEKEHEITLNVATQVHRNVHVGSAYETQSNKSLKIRHSIFEQGELCEE